VNGENGVGLPDQIKVLRHQLASEMGFVLPSVRLQDNLELSASTYVIRIKELEAARGELRMNMLLVMDPQGGPISLNGEATTDPTFGLAAMWVPQTLRAQAENLGYTVVDSATVLTTHLAEVIKDNIQELLSFSEIERLLESLDKAHKKILTDLVPGQITLNVIQRVLQNLLMERISIRDLGTILEAIAEACSSTRSTVLITEHVRGRLSRQLSFGNLNHEYVLPLVTLSPEWEKAFGEAIVGEGENKQLAMVPSRLQEFIKLLRQNFDHQTALGENPILLTTPTLRPFLRSVIERFRPSTVILSQNEIHPKVKIKTVGQIQ
jgi:flagellar biosynthesis protein FlhA